MARPPCCRRVLGQPLARCFMPLGVPRCRCAMVTMTLDEFEALRLADGERLYQADAAARMGVSRATFGRIIESARAKVAEALTAGKGLQIEGGFVTEAHARVMAPEAVGPVPCPRGRCPKPTHKDDEPDETGGCRNR